MTTVIATTPIVASTALSMIFTSEDMTARGSRTEHDDEAILARY
ncbi:hypothetical protein [Bradyrhizobium tropiciagri]|nr:hypothetical protein [Bradyrhizobium tropiciagri]